MSQLIIFARQIVNFLESQEQFKILHPPERRYDHIGGLLADAILQPGLNYKNVVEPRVLRIIRDYKSYDSVSDFLRLCISMSPQYILGWEDNVKPYRLMRVLFVLNMHGIESVADLSSWLSSDASKDLLHINGIGEKTFDYLNLLAGNSSIPVDRHFKRLFSFLEINISCYTDIKRTLEFSADLFDINRHTFDYSLWRFLSNKSSLSMNP